MKGILLDTHVLIWLMNAAPELALKHQKIINEAAENSVIGIAAISVWEISLLAARDRLTLQKPLAAWVQEALALPGIALQPLTPEIAIESNQLPDSFHGDPADRMIVATARMNQLTLLTRDHRILDYAKKEYLSAMSV